MERSSEIFLKKWTEIRKKGRLAYALKQGIIMAILVLLVRNLFKLRTQTLSEIISAFNFYDALIVFVGAILGYYVIMWWIYENQYKQKTRNND